MRQRPLRHFGLIALAMVATFGSVAPLAWGVQGHRLVALIATSRLTPAARANVTWLLPDRTLADVASWADQMVTDNSQTAPWHYLNIPPDATGYDRDRDCPRQPGVAAGSRSDVWRDCAVDRILYHEQRLANTSLDRADRAIALKYLVHFIGDLHQPFHALGVGRGGNDVRVVVFGSPTCSYPDGATFPCNLHGVWDSTLISRRQLNDALYVDALSSLIAQRGLASRPTGSPAEWAVESHGLAKAALPAQGIVDEAYYRAQIAVIDERLAIGGLRLATVLNRSLPAPPR